MSTQTAPAGPHLDGLPQQLRDQVARLIDDYNRRAAPFRADLLPPGGVEVKASTSPRGEWISPATPTIDLLRRWNDWWDTGLRTAETILDVEQKNGTELLATAGGILSEIIRARVGIISAFAAASFDPDLAAGPPIAEDGSITTVNGVVIPLTGAAVAGPKPKLPKVSTYIEPGSDPQAVAAYLRRIAEEIEATGRY